MGGIEDGVLFADASSMSPTPGKRKGDRAGKSVEQYHERSGLPRGMMGRGKDVFSLEKTGRTWLLVLSLEGGRGGNPPSGLGRVLRSIGRVAYRATIDTGSVLCDRWPVESLNGWDWGKDDADERGRPGAQSRQGALFATGGRWRA